jgi:Sec-independent protein secretion pathway component TatC
MRGLALIFLVGIFVLAGVVAPSKPITAFIVLAVICGALSVAIQMAQFVRMRINIQTRIMMQQERERQGKK